MRTNAAVITVYNRKYDKATRLDTWQKTVIPDVNFSIDTKINVGDKGLSSADVIKVRVPENLKLSESYLDEDAWATTTDTTGKWTLQPDDYIVLGEGPDIEKPKDLKKSYKIISFSDNRIGTTSPHWRIGGT